MLAALVLFHESASQVLAVAVFFSPNIDNNNNNKDDNNKKIFWQGNNNLSHSLGVWWLCFWRKAIFDKRLLVACTLAFFWPISNLKVTKWLSSISFPCYLFSSSLSPPGDQYFRLWGLRSIFCPPRSSREDRKAKPRGIILNMCGNWHVLFIYYPSILFIFIVISFVTYWLIYLFILLLSAVY